MSSSPSLPPHPSEDDSLDLSDWEPDDPVLSEIPDASADLLESRRRFKQAEVKEHDEVHPPPEVRIDTAMERAAFQTDPDRFLKCLAILETVLKLRQKQGVEHGQPPTTDDLTRLAMSTLQALPIDLEANTDFLIQFVSRTIGQAQQSTELQKLQTDLETSKPNQLTGVELKEIVRVHLPTEANEALDTVSEAWGKQPLDLGLGTIKFDEGRAVLEDVQQIPGVGAALISKDGKFRARFYRTFWWSSLVVSLILLLLVLLSFMRWATPEPEIVNEPSLVDESLYMSPDLNALDIALKGYVGAEDWRSQLSYVRHPQIMEAKMNEHFKSQPFRWGYRYHLLKANLEIIDGVPQVICLIKLEPTKEQRALLVEITQSGKYLVDWEYAEIWQEVSWGDFVRREDSTPADLLVVLKPGRYYNFGYHDRKVFQCWEILDPSEEGLSFFGYTKRGSNADQALRRLMEDRILRMRKTFFTVVLRLRHAEDSEDSLQVEIMDVVEESALRRH